MRKRSGDAALRAVIALGLGLIVGLAPGTVQAQTQSIASSPVHFRLDRPLVQGGVARGHVAAGTRNLMLDDQPVAFAADGSFLIAMDRDAGPLATLTLTTATGDVTRHQLAVAPRAWRLQRLNRVARFPQPSAEFAARRPAELARIAAARGTTTDAGGWRQQFIWPTTGRISGYFGAQRIYRGEPGAYHSGVDIARPSGTPIVAPADGIVTLAVEAPFTLEGRLLMVDHGMGLNSAFLHLSRIDVREGDRVRQGQVIGAVGASGRASGPHLHWGMKWHDARIDPMLIAGRLDADNGGNVQEAALPVRQDGIARGTAAQADD